MIKLQNFGRGWMSPRIYCDYCGEQINNALEANVLHVKDTPGEFFTVHRGVCGFHFEREQRMHFQWLRLDEFLVMLFDNTGLDVTGVRAARKETEKLNEIFANLPR